MKAYMAGMAVVAMVLAVVMMVGPAFAGQTQAERERALRQRADPESAIGWQVRAPVETGGLPAGEAGTKKPEKSVATNQFPTIEAGGVTYRVGIDTY